MLYFFHGRTAAVVSHGLVKEASVDSDYEGHSLKMLKRIAEALNKRVEIRFVPRKEKLQPA